ncbi:MAG: hypothetical protein JSV45_04620 [Chromatiales bacterium]|nr:MAG: hypothetical protein JSV45_04620 [Chromatiales bacterium]
MNQLNPLFATTGRVLLAGGFLFVVANGPGEWSIDARRGRRVAVGATS